MTAVPAHVQAALGPADAGMMATDEGVWRKSDGVIRLVPFDDFDPRVPFSAVVRGDADRSWVANIAALCDISLDAARNLPAPAKAYTPEQIRDEALVEAREAIRAIPQKAPTADRFGLGEYHARRLDLRAIDALRDGEGE